MDNRNVILEAQKIIEDWAVIHSIKRVLAGVASMPITLQQNPPPCEKDLALWFCQTVLDFATECDAPFATKAPQANIRKGEQWHGGQCVLEINKLLTNCLEGFKAKGNSLAAEIIVYTASSLRNTIAAIKRDENSPLVRVALHNLQATFERVQSGSHRVSPLDAPAPCGYPVLLENATPKSVRDLSRGQSRPL
ncbi:hypothetical protein [Acidithiobacillus sp.]